MIKRTELPGILQSLPGFSSTNVVYRAFAVDKALTDPEQAPALPFVAYYFAEEPAFHADGINYFTSTHVYIELYTKYKDLATEQLFDQLFTANNIAFDKDGDYLHDDRDYMTVYDFYLSN